MVPLRHRFIGRFDIPLILRLRNDGMSDEPKKGSYWLIAILPALAVLVTYLGAYYATTQEVRLQDGTNRLVGVYYVHNVGGRQVPWWAKLLFWPGDRIDQLVRGREWR